MLYGLSVTGTAHPQKILRNNTLKEGDLIILTKPLGMGILTTAIKADLVGMDVIVKVADILRELNYKASVIAREKANAMTDVTGFGLLGHLYEMSADKMNSCWKL